MFDQLLTHARVATMEVTAPFGLIERGAIAIDGAAIAWVGPLQALPSREAGAVHDLGGRLVTPGLVDPHTHLVYGGDRAKEFELRLQGASYEEIFNLQFLSVDGSNLEAFRSSDDMQF